MRKTNNKSAYDSDMINAWISRYLELKEAYQEYCRLGQSIRHAVKGKRCLKLPDYKVSGRWVLRKSYVVPEAKYWQMKIEPLIQDNQIDKPHLTDAAIR
jgi:hypothetical protein